MIVFYKEELKTKAIEAQRRVLALRVRTDRCRDLSLEKKLKRELLLSRDDSGYPYCQKLAQQSRQGGARMLRAPSARDARGFCTPLFDSSLVTKDEGHLKYLRCLLQTDGTARITGLIEEETKIYKI